VLSGAKSVKADLSPPVWAGMPLRSSRDEDLSSRNCGYYQQNRIFAVVFLKQ